ncbi:hypothetical protein [Paenibacillus cremeus]|nr:hypothetical protein [Paenibacillus cremeus]
MEEMRSAHTEVEWYEGTEQPGLFVEIWSGLSDAGYEDMLAARRGDGPVSFLWERAMQLQNWVPGGREKIHIWQFRKVK